MQNAISKSRHATYYSGGKSHVLDRDGEMPGTYHSRTDCCVADQISRSVLRYIMRANVDHRSSTVKKEQQALSHSGGKVIHFRP
jgi:hypothetical protein